MISLHAERPQAKREKSCSQVRRTRISQPNVNSPADRILFIQQTAGNQVVQRLIQSGKLQANLRIGQPLPEPVRAYFEPRFGYDFSGVRVHLGQKAEESAGSINALAYTVGKDIVFGAGQYQPQTSAGKRLLAHELTHVIQQSTTNPTIQRIQACPPSWPDPVPSGWQRYHGNPNVFHCGFRGILENRIPTPDDPQNECFYDHSGTLVDQNHPYAGCRGTPNQYDSDDSPVSHTLRDTGGILYAGPDAFITSRVYDITQAIAGAIRVVQTAGNIAGSITDALGQVIVSGILSARATVDPINWRFQGLPSRSIRHLNVIGGILSSISWNQNLNGLLANITRRLDSFPIPGLIDEITEDINQALRSHNPNVLHVRASDIGTLSLLQLIDWLHSQGLIQYVRPPGDIAREELNSPQK
ncbi:hypothetical protein ANME2D_02559 [Candidatus Methanoperedens nitroreducens]|uniref:eCIS core domain-containing protein n=1 Tax=Candidatus Methanoperedens nitratireducens TaxID=1392998 RepID=A0A062V410_9EURY|nr:hypothetical protein ANME2D_02559 [Candidatus Methanoperedens nitroreducens]